MSLDSGSELGPYRIVGAFGAGGMGEVYRATDTRLDRTVAIKVLPGHVADDPVQRERFEREARAIAALNHRVRRSFGPSTLKRFPRSARTRLHRS